MPELPEVETLRRDLLIYLPGEQIKDVEVLRAASVGYPPDPVAFAAALVGQIFDERMVRRGKYLLLFFESGDALGVHLRMSGRLLWRSADAPLEVHTRVRLFLNSGHELRFEDLRVFGRLWFVPAAVASEQVVTGLTRLGPEPFSAEFSGDYLIERLRRRKQPIKTALLDQSLVAGVGNIYADEALFISGIDPTISAHKLTGAAIERLRQAVIRVLEQGIAQRGTTLRNYTDAQGVNGNYAGGAWVYGRRGEPCRNCGTPIERVRLAGRSTHFCPACQRVQ